MQPLVQFYTFLSRNNQEISKAMHLMEKLVISEPFVILNFGTSLHALYNHYFVKFLQNNEAKLTQNKLCFLFMFHYFYFRQQIVIF